MMANARLAGKLSGGRRARPMPDYHSVDATIAWVDAAVHCLNEEDVALRTARGRVLTKDIRAAGPIPAGNRAARDGFAVEASASLGASSYNPVRLPMVAVAAGDALPTGTDAVVPIERAEPDGQASIEVIEAVAAGDNVEQQGAVAPIGAMLVGRRNAACRAPYRVADECWRVGGPGRPPAACADIGSQAWEARRVGGQQWPHDLCCGRARGRYRRRVCRGRARPQRHHRGAGRARR